MLNVFLPWNQRLKNALIFEPLPNGLSSLIIYDLQDLSVAISVSLGEVTTTLMVFHIKFTSDILTDRTRVPLGTLDITFCESKMFIRRNSLNRLMGHKLN